MKCTTAGYAGLAQIDETLAAAEVALGAPITAMMIEGPAEALNITTTTQPAMLASDVAVCNAWLAAGGPKPALLAGHSLG